MQFIQTPDTATPISDLRNRLISELTDDKKVLWLLSGGSNIAIATHIMDGVSAELSVNLTISLIDERYGPVGHPDSNFASLLSAGFDAKQATVIPVLRGELTDIDSTAAAFNNFLRQALTNNDVSIGLLGIGQDGHTSGILPDSPPTAVTFESTLLATCYTSTDSRAFSRITTTFTALKMLSASYCCAYGQDKLEVLTRLQQTEVRLAVQPAQILKQIDESYVYNDVIGELS